MEPSDIDGLAGGETLGGFLARLLVEEGAAWYVVPGNPKAVGLDGIFDLEDVAAQFKAAVLAGQI